MGLRFRSDRRAVSEVVGAILLLGILILALTSYQAAVVPNQNAQAEFQHNLQVEDEMVDLRNAILEARSSGTQTFASITLGTQYRERLVAINSPPATGTLQTVQQENISVTETGGQERPDPIRLDDRPLENQFIEYTPRYAEYQSAGTIRYENTVTYHQYPTGNITLTNQRLLQDDRVTLAPIEGTVDEIGTRRVTVDPIPGVLQTTDIEDPEITLPTKLSEADWNRILDEELSGGDSLSVDDGVLTLSLEGVYEVAYSPVGANRPPSEGVRGGSAGEINPASPGNIQLIGTEWGNNDDVTLTFRNSAGDNSFTQGRINFYFSGSQGGTPTQVDDVFVVDENGNVVDEDGNIGGPSRGSDWVIGEDFNDLDPNVELEGDDTRTRLRFDFNNNPSVNNDFFIVTLTLESGEQATYFVGDSIEPEDQNGNGNGGNGDANLQVTDGNGDNGDVTFSVENIGSDDAVIDGISVDSTDNNNADRVERDGNEFERTDGDGSLDEVIEIGGERQNLDTDVIIEEETEADFLVGLFESDGQSNINMNNNEVTITFYLSDGTEQQLLIEG